MRPHDLDLLRRKTEPSREIHRVGSNALGVPRGVTVHLVDGPQHDAPAHAIGHRNTGGFEHAVERHGDGALGQRRGNALGNIEAGDSRGEFTDSAVGESSYSGDIRVTMKMPAVTIVAA
mgnify:CR=1 FL=1